MIRSVAARIPALASFDNGLSLSTGGGSQLEEAMLLQYINCALVPRV